MNSTSYIALGLATTAMTTGALETEPGAFILGIGMLLCGLVAEAAEDS